MKKIHFIKALVLLFSVIAFTSCETEVIDPALVLLAQEENPNCLSPNSVSGAFVSSTSVTLTWTPVAGETSWQIQYGTTGFALGTGTIVSATSPSLTISGLQATITYDFWIRSVCGAEEFGDWTDPFTLAPPNPNCPTPSGLTVVRNAGNTSATVNWSNGGSETQWDVLYVAAGFSPSTGTTLSASSKPFTVSGLTNESYDFYVRAKCSGSEMSSWSALKNLPEVSTGGTGVVGNYLLTAFISSTPTDINADGNSSSNILSETTCFNNMFLNLLPNNTFTADSKGADIEIDIVNNVEVETIQCFVDPIETGTWALNGTTLTLSFPDSTDTFEYIYNSANNTLSAIENDGSIVGTTSQGDPITLTTNLTVTYTKQ